jgi:predicted Zn-dependent protease
MSTPSDGARFEGSFSDGRRATATPVAVRFAVDGLEIRSPEEKYAKLWPYSQLTSNVPLDASAIDVVLSVAQGPETLLVADQTFIAILMARAPDLSTVRQRWQGAKPGLAALAAVLVIAIGVRTFELHPAQTIARMLPQQTREAMGRNVLASFTGQRKVCETPAGRAALDRMTQRLTAAASDKPLGVRVLLLDWALVNAFAVPGGQIVITRGLVQAARSPDEVAGVLAHELGHALELHPEAGLIRAMGLAAAGQLVFAGSSGTVSNIGLLLTQLRYSRVAEREADVHALRILRNAEISPKGLADFFQRLDRPTTGKAKTRTFRALELISTHPLTAERIAMVRAQPPYPATAALADDDWRALREACGAAAATPVPAPGTPPAPPRPPDTSAAERDIVEASKALEANPNDLAALQKRARAYTRTSRHDLALGDYTKAAEIKPDDANLHYGRGSALQAMRQYDEALKAYDEVLRLAPNHAAGRNNRGNVYRALKRYDDALADFGELIRSYPDYVHAHYNRGLVYRELNRNEEALADYTATIARDKDYTAAYASRALLHERMGAREKAIEDFRAALAAPAKYNNGAWAHTTARDRLKKLGVDTP